MNKFLFWLMILTSFLFVSCTTGRASENHSEDKIKVENSFILNINYNNTPNISVQIELIDEDDPDLYPPLTIETSPVDASIFISGIYYGQSTKQIIDLSPGTYPVTIKAEGYKTTNFWITINKNESKYIMVNLQRKTGLLQLDITPEEAKVYIDGSLLTTSIATIPTGIHSLKIALFGYKTITKNILIYENQSTRVTTVLERAPFEITGLSKSREVLNPLNPGNLGRSIFHFSISNYGSGMVEIIDRNNTIVKTIPLDEFTQWDQSFFWDGTDNTGKVVPEGMYSLRLSAIGQDGVRMEIIDQIYIDYSFVISYRNNYSGLSGLMFVTIPENLPPHSFQFGSTYTFSVNNSDYELPFSLSSRFSLGKKMELNLFSNFAISQSKDSLITLSAGFKEHLIKKAFYSLGLSQKISYEMTTGGALGSSLDKQTNMSGLYIGIPLMAEFNYWKFILSPEIALSLTDYSNSTSGNLQTWGYLRGGILYDRGFASLGLSAALRTQSGFSGLQMPLETGLEGQVLIPETQCFVSGILQMRVQDIDNLSFSGGFGFGIIN